MSFDWLQGIVELDGEQLKEERREERREEREGWAMRTITGRAKAQERRERVGNACMHRRIA